jgi:hypothetical protein
MPVEASFQTFGFLLTLYFPETWLARGMGWIICYTEQKYSNMSKNNKSKSIKPFCGGKLIQIGCTPGQSCEIHRLGPNEFI